MNVGANPFARSSFGKLFTFVFVCRWHECLQILLDVKADVAVKDMLGRTPRCLSVQVGAPLNLLKALLTYEPARIAKTVTA